MALVSVVVGLASGAGAAGAPTSVRPLAHPESASSSYLAGYQVAPPAGLASASATFTLPAVSCTSADETNDALVLNGVYSDDLEVYALAGAECLSGGPQYVFLFSTPNGSFTETDATPGDVIVTSLLQSGSNTWAEIHDLTANLYWFASDPANLGETTVDIGTYNQVDVGNPVPTFTKTAFTNTTVNGDYLGFESPTQYNALNGGDLLLKTGALATSGTGSTFSVKFKHAS